MPNHLLTTQALPTWRQRCALRLLVLFGWRILFAPLPGPRGVLIVYPHTSNWDFFVGLLAKWAIDLPFHWLGKEALFQGVIGTLIGPILRVLGGEPIERKASTGAIERLAKRIQDADWYWLVLTPEGTRSYRKTWRSGFYHIALTAKVPLVAASFDYATKTVHVETVIHLTGDKETDRAAIALAYAGKRGYQPENAGAIDW
ncbi:MAG: 1-acyl-sn-glycerol-3-phosphate acyltransferase [Burkholderiaceae bacterium]